MFRLTKETHDYFGEPIMVYSSRDAIADGHLFEPLPISYPGWLLTGAVHDAFASMDRDYLGLVTALFCRVYKVTEHRADSIIERGLEHNPTGRPLWIGRNDIGGWTIMFPEDY